METLVEPRELSKAKLLKVHSPAPNPGVVQPLLLLGLECSAEQKAAHSSWYLCLRLPRHHCFP